MPLSEKARIEVYLPDLPLQAYADLLDALDQEFTYTFGGSTIIHGLDGSYLSQLGLRIRDRVNLIYTDTPLLSTTTLGSYPGMRMHCEVQLQKHYKRKPFWL